MVPANYFFFFRISNTLLLPGPIAFLSFFLSFFLAFFLAFFLSFFLCFFHVYYRILLVSVKYFYIYIFLLLKLFYFFLFFLFFLSFFNAYRLAPQSPLAQAILLLVFFFFFLVFKFLCSPRFIVRHSYFLSRTDNSIKRDKYICHY